jgi:uncharacterized membrane protein
LDRGLGSLLVFASVSILSIYNQLLILGCVMLHLGIDKLKSALAERRVIPGKLVGLSARPAIASVTLMVAALLLTGTSFRALIQALQIPEVTKIHILEIAIVYAAVVFGCGYFIRSMTKGMAKSAAAESSSPLDNAGLYIGWIERSLVITAITLQSPALVGLILTGKSMPGCPNSKKPNSRSIS